MPTPISKPYLDEINARIAECKEHGVDSSFAESQKRHIIREHAKRVKREKSANNETSR